MKVWLSSFLFYALLLATVNSYQVQGSVIEPGPIALESLHQLHQPLKLQLLFGLRSDAGIDAGHRHILEPVASEVPMMRCEVIGMVPLVHDKTSLQALCRDGPSAPTASAKHSICVVHVASVQGR